MLENILVRGVIIGLAIAAPVGPIGLLCIQRTIRQGRLAGLVTGLGAATADAVYGSVAAFGLTFVSSFLLDQGRWFGLVGGLFLLYLGLRTFMASPSSSAETGPGGGNISAYVTTFLLTLTNPATILSFVAIFAGLGLVQYGGDAVQAVMLVLGVFVGSAVWWLLLSSSISLIRNQFSDRHMRWVNRLAGLIISAFGLLALFQF